MPRQVAISRTAVQSSAGTLTVSGNEITDATRTTNTQGDGVTPPDSSYGIWQGTTNIIANGGLESNTTNWNTNLGSTISRDTSTYKFGTASLKVITPGAALYEGAYYKYATSGVTSGQVYTGSAWVKAPVGSTLYINLSSHKMTPTDTQLQSWSTYFTATGDWQRVSITGAATPATTDGMILLVDTRVSIQGITYYVDGAQIELSSVATPYVETNGGTAARTAARVQAPSTTLDTTQAWIAFRTRMGWPSTTAPNAGPRVFGWSDGTTSNRIDAYITNSAILNRASGGTNVLLNKATTFSIGDIKTFIFAWTSTNLYVSVDGSDFTSAGSTGIPSGLQANFDIGTFTNFTTDRELDSDILWFASGKGTLTNTDASTINGWGNTDPTIGQLNQLATAQPTMCWNANTVTFEQAPRIKALARTAVSTTGRLQVV